MLWVEWLKWGLHCHKIAPCKLTGGGQNVDNPHGKCIKIKKSCEKLGCLYLIGSHRYFLQGTLQVWPRDNPPVNAIPWANRVSPATKFFLFCCRTQQIFLGTCCELGGFGEVQGGGPAKPVWQNRNLNRNRLPARPTTHDF
jgi:hypothetical protein